MKNIKAIEEKLIPGNAIARWVKGKRLTAKTIAFTNGCFDILHEGHIYSIMQAAKEADVLVIGINSDSSVKRIKGEDRPINAIDKRTLILASLELVDAVVVFEEDTPLELIKKVMPDVLVKGGDYSLDKIVGADEVIANGGQVIINPLIKNTSTSGIIEKIKNL